MERPSVQAPDTFYTGKQAIRPRAPFPGACPPGHERREPDRRKARQRFRRAGTNSESFVRLFLTLGENTLDYLSRINK